MRPLRSLAAALVTVGLLGAQGAGNPARRVGRLVIRPDDPSLDHLALALRFSDDQVAEMSAGPRWLVQGDDVCAWR